MITKEFIKSKLQEDPFWQPPATATDEEMKLFYSVLKEMEEAAGINEGDFDSDTKGYGSSLPDASLHEYLPEGMHEETFDEMGSSSYDSGDDDY